MEAKEMDLSQVYVKTGEADLCVGELVERWIAEAATVKTRAQALLRDIAAILADRTVPGAVRKELEDVRVVMKRTWADLQADADGEGKEEQPEEAQPEEAAKPMRTVDGVEYSADAFLVVEEAESPSTWHLQVLDRNGKPDHRLMGAAHAALLSPRGFRGSRYEGPSKRDAIAKLKRLYEEEEMVWPEEARESDSGSDATIGEVIRKEDGKWVLYTKDGRKVIRRFDTEKDAEEWERNIERFAKRAEEAAQPDLEGSPEAVAEAAQPESVADASEGPAALDIFIEEGTPVGQTTIAEAGTIAELEPSQGDGDRRRPVALMVRLLTPGPGNPKDRHYYPPEVVRRDAHVFEGAKMFLTDHRPEERSVQTQVSVVERITGFSPDGAPLARVLVYDPAMCEKVRNLADVSRLDQLAVSILGTGTSRKGRVGNEDYQVVERIDEGLYVDWVTRAGAGGQALALAESDTKREEAPRVDKDRIAAVLQEARLPDQVKALLSEREWESEEKLGEAITGLVEAMKGGQPIGAGATPEPKQRTREELLAERNARLDAIDARYGPKA